RETSPGAVVLISLPLRPGLREEIMRHAFGCLVLSTLAACAGRSFSDIEFDDGGYDGTGSAGEVAGGSAGSQSGASAAGDQASASNPASIGDSSSGGRGGAGRSGIDAGVDRGGTCKPLPDCSSSTVCKVNCNTCQCLKGAWSCTKIACPHPGDEPAVDSCQSD